MREQVVDVPPQEVITNLNQLKKHGAFNNKEVKALIDGKLVAAKKDMILGHAELIRDAGYDLLPMIREALDIKKDQQEQDLKIIASAWTAPAWMKDIETWFIKGSPENNWQGTGGTLKSEHVSDRQQNQ